MELSRKTLQARMRKRKGRSLQHECVKDMNDISLLLETNSRKICDSKVGEYPQVSRDDEYIGFENWAIVNENNDEIVTAAIDMNDDILKAEIQGDHWQDNILQKADDMTDTDKLKHWAIEHSISGAALNGLLGILRGNVMPQLPKSAKTFLGTAAVNFTITNMEDCTSDEPGKFVYMGIATGLQCCIGEFHTDDINLTINIDGLPLSRSRGKTFWPILCKVHYIPDIYKPFVVANYCGDSKPKYLPNYLEQFIEEINQLQEHGIEIFQKTFIVKLKCFVADTPARSYLKCTKGHGGYSACERCTIPGTRYVMGKKTKIIYPGDNYELRSDESFRNKADQKHHVGTSPLENINPRIKMSSAFILDYMHLACVGVMKKILELLMYGPRNVRLSASNKLDISRRILCLKSQIPSEFQRKIRSIFYVRQWKATEFRFFLLYCGPIVLRNIIRENLFKHFLLLHYAFRILCSDNLAISLNAEAKKYLTKFVALMPFLYGSTTQVMNVHNLLHISDDVINLGCSLSRVNCFPFENTLGRIKRDLRTAVKPLAQFCRREYERMNIIKSNISFPSEFKIIKYDISNCVLDIKKMNINYSTYITTYSPDNIVLLKNYQIMQINSISGTEATASSVMIHGKVWCSMKCIYEFPKKSSVVDAWEIDMTAPHVNATFSVFNIMRKMIMMKVLNKKSGSDEVFVLSLLHT